MIDGARQSGEKFHQVQPRIFRTYRKHTHNQVADPRLFKIRISIEGFAEKSIPRIHFVFSEYHRNAALPPIVKYRENTDKVPFKKEVEPKIEKHGEGFTALHLEQNITIQFKTTEVCTCCSLRDIFHDGINIKYSQI